MAMFDEIITKDYRLPGHQGEGVFQTYDLGEHREFYRLDAEGKLWRYMRDAEGFARDTNLQRRCLISKTVLMIAYVNDLYIAYEIVFENGVVKSIERTKRNNYGEHTPPFNPDEFLEE